jgi:hypothetical protein
MIRKLLPLLLAASLTSCISPAGSGPLSQDSSFPSFASEIPSLELAFAEGDQILQDLPDGTKYFGATGTVTNTSSIRQGVPDILIIFSDSRGTKVSFRYIRPEKQSIDPGEVIPLNAYIVGVSPLAKYADIGWHNGIDAGPKSKGEQVYGVFLKAPEGKIRFAIDHGSFSNLAACQEIIKSYNDGTFDARLPGIYACEPVSGSLP